MNVRLRYTHKINNSLKRTLMTQDHLTRAALGCCGRDDCYSKAEGRQVYAYTVIYR